MGLRDVTLNQFSFPFLGQMWCCRTAGLEGTVCSMQDLSRAMRLGWVGFGGIDLFSFFLLFFWSPTYLSCSAAGQVQVQVQVQLACPCLVFRETRGHGGDGYNRDS